MNETRLSCEQCGQFNECKYYEHRNAQSRICNNFRYNNDVVKALEKQVPKKIVKNDNGWECPHCGAFFATFGGNFIDTNFCPNCGQAIEWDKSR